MVAVDLDESLSVVVEPGESKPCAYAVVHDGEEVARYETSADPRTTAGRIGLRNVVCRHAPGYDKSAVGEELSAAFSEHEDALAEELGTR